MSEGTYYVPTQSRLPIWASLGLFLTLFGAANWINGNPEGPYIWGSGLLVLAVVLWNWFGTVIDEHLAGKTSPQLKGSYVRGMSWFIFSEVMFFAAFFGALFYIRTFALPWLSGEGGGVNNPLIWPDFQAQWPLMNTPDMVVNGSKAVELGPQESMSLKGGLLSWLPFWNTVLLLSSSVTVHLAHTALKRNARKAFNIFLGVTIVLGASFVTLQAIEYHEAYTELGLTLHSGIYGTTFFMLTGFHGAHVIIGTFMLTTMWLRSVVKGHFKPDDHFGFEAASWYWHFVDVVWVGLFFAVYVFA